MREMYDKWLSTQNPSVLQKKKTLKSKDHFSRLAKVFTKGRWIFSFFATTCSNMYMYNAIMSCACRDASLEVQRPLWNEQRDNLKQSKKNTSSTCSFLFLFLHADIAQKRPAGVDIPILSVELERVPTSAFNSYKAQSTSANDRRLHARTRWLPWRSENDSQHFRDMTLQAPPPFFYFNFFFWGDEERKARKRGRTSWESGTRRFFCCRSHNESGPNPLPPIWKFFRLSAMCEILRWPLK